MKRLLSILLLVFSVGVGAETLELLGTGTGFVINTDHIVTAEHVVDDCERIKVRYGDQVITARIVASDPANDLAALLLESSIDNIAKFRGGKPIRLGESIATYGYPLTGQLSSSAKITQGNINSLAGIKNDSRVFQYDASTQPGNSGGPLLDKSGNVVGVVSHRLSTESNVNFAIKSYVVEVFLQSNQIKFEKSDFRKSLELPDLAENSEKFTVLIGCWGDAGIKFRSMENGLKVETSSSAERVGDFILTSGEQEVRGVEKKKCEGKTVTTFETKERFSVSHLGSVCNHEEQFGDSETRSYEEKGMMDGETTIHELFSGTWKIRLLDGSPSFEQKGMMDAAASRYSPFDVYPEGSTKVGQSWDIPPGAFPLLIGYPLFNATGSATGHFKSIVDHKGVKCALVIFNGSVKGSLSPNKYVEASASFLIDAQHYFSIKDKFVVYSETKVDAQVIQSHKEDSSGPSQTEHITMRGKEIAESRVVEQ